MLIDVVPTVEVAVEPLDVSIGVGLDLFILASKLPFLQHKYMEQSGRTKVIQMRPQGLHTQDWLGRE